MRAVWVNERRDGPLARVVELPDPRPGPGELLVRVDAVSLNYRDLGFYRGTHPSCPDVPLIPCSDMAGEVVAIGADVQTIGVGHRVMSVFQPGWVDGPPDAATIRPRFGGPADGVACELRLFREEEVIDISASRLSTVEAACLPCAGVTAWNALDGGRGLRSKTVLIPGSGGVATVAAAMAVAAGARVALLSGNAAKLDRLESLGAEHYLLRRPDADWPATLREVTGGVDLALAYGDPGGFSDMLEALATGGTIALLGGMGDRPIGFAPSALFTKAATIRGIAGGSRTMLTAMIAAIDGWGIRPVCDHVFPLADVDTAFRLLAAGTAVGKICIAMD
jgi:2-desacetyl-2-hydroxyethyl bacteriochlorophyllide A dehydrogenase